MVPTLSHWQICWTGVRTQLQQFSTPHKHCQRSLNHLPKVWKLIFTVQVLWSTSIKIIFSPYIYHPLQVFFSSLLMKTSCWRLKLVELNFLVSFNTDDQSKTDVANTVNVITYKSKSSRWTFSMKIFRSAIAKKKKRRSWHREINRYIDYFLNLCNICKWPQFFDKLSDTNVQLTKKHFIIIDVKNLTNYQLSFN